VPPVDCADFPDDPIVQFRAWMEEARAGGAQEPEALTLATAGEDGRPSARTVLLRGLDERGFRFYTNYASRKARELDANPRATLVFFWREISRQVIVSGDVERTSAADSDAYFASRAPESRLGAWASRQGAELGSREELEARVAELERRFGDRDIPRPDFWGGFLLRPDAVEFWRLGPFRLHDRCLYLREGDGWSVRRLSP
jgi:pyridoxamine 5'-phosphate oxidase